MSIAIVIAVGYCRLFWIDVFIIFFNASDVDFPGRKPNCLLSKRE